MLVQRLCGYSIDAGCSVLTSGQSAAALLHLASVLPYGIDAVVSDIGAGWLDQCGQDSAPASSTRPARISLFLIAAKDGLDA